MKFIPKYGLLICFFLLSYVSIFGQEAFYHQQLHKADSLIAAKEYNSALAYVQEVLKDEQILANDFPKAYFSSLMNIGEILLKTGKFEVARDYLCKIPHISFRAEKPKQKHLGKSYYYLGVAYQYTAKIDSAIWAYQYAINILESIQDKELLDAVYNNLGILYKNVENYSRAIELHRKSLTLKRFYYPDQIGNALNNLGVTHKNIGDLDSAEYYIEEYIKIAKTPEQTAIGFDNLARIYERKAETYRDEKSREQKQKWLKKAVEMDKKALDLRKEAADIDSSNLGSNYYNIGTYYHNLEEWEQAKVYYEQGLEISKSIEGTNTLLSDLFLNLSDVYFSLGEEQRAMQYLKTYIQLYDNNRLTSDLKARVMGYERKLHLDKLKMDRFKAGGIIVLLIVALMCVSVLYSYHHSTSTQELLEKKQEILEKERELYKENQLKLVQKHAEELLKTKVKAQEKTLQYVAGELHDHIGNSIAILIGRLKGEKDDIYRNVYFRLKDVYGNVQNLSRYLKGLYLENGLLPSLKRLCNDLKTDGLKVDLYTFNLEGKHFDPKVEANIFRIIQEALTNSIKSAKTSEITIQLIYRTYKLSVSIEDNGDGFDLAEVKKGMGLASMEERALELKGTFEIDSAPQQGTTIFVEIPAFVKSVQFLNGSEKQKS